MSPKAHASVSNWLIFVCLMILAMVAIGGITRLTGSGLSIVDWNPIMGAIPPLNEPQWNEVFSRYQSSPQYLLVNRGMGLQEFKSIFFWEYFHRLFGRLIGCGFLLPLLYFWARGALNRELKGKLALGFLLGGAQGLVGWLMVKSGLVNEPRVSHYRLATHLCLALGVASYLFWIALDLRAERSTAADDHEGATILPSWFVKAARLVSATLLLQIIYGAFTAGTRAGFLFNSFPKMGGEWFPTGFFRVEPVFLNFLENQVAIQFIHRTIAWVLLLGILVLWWAARDLRLSRSQRLSLNCLAIGVMIQFALGVLTLVYVVPVHLGVIHQLGAFLLFLCGVALNHANQGEPSERSSSRLTVSGSAAIPADRPAI